MHIMINKGQHDIGFIIISLLHNFNGVLIRITADAMFSLR